MMDEVTSPREGAGRPFSVKRRSGIVVPHAPVWQQRLAAWIVFAAVRVVGATVRWTWEDPHGVLEKPPEGPLICCIWHNRLALVMPLYKAFTRMRPPPPGMAALVSASKDGGLLAAILERFGVKPVRGSTSRRGPQALLELMTWAERGYDLAITPDGPRGPRYQVQDGVMALAQVTGLQVVSASYSLNWKIRARSWDGFLIPLPFARGVVTIGKPFGVPRQATDAEREELRKQFESDFRAITRD